MRLWGVRLFRRPRQQSLSHPIFEFWAWWREVGHTADPHSPSTLLDDLQQRVAAINSELAWHFSAGIHSKHRLTVSSGGNAHLRPTAERWLRAAPPADEKWEFRAAQERGAAAASTVLEIDSARVDLSQLQFGLRTDRQLGRIDAEVYHPSFSIMAKQSRVRVAFLALDKLLGEDDVERWLGKIEVLVRRPDSPRTPEDLVDVVEGLRQLDPREWLLGQSEDSTGKQLMISIRPYLRWIDYPTFDHHLILIKRYRTRADGFPADNETLYALHDLADALEDTLQGRGILAGYTTHQGQRAFHVYLDGEDENTQQAVKEWARSRNLKVHSAPDPAWRHIQQLTC